MYSPVSLRSGRSQVWAGKSKAAATILDTQFHFEMHHTNMSVCTNIHDIQSLVCDGYCLEFSNLRGALW